MRAGLAGDERLIGIARAITRICVPGTRQLAAAGNADAEMWCRGFVGDSPEAQTWMTDQPFSRG